MGRKHLTVIDGERVERSLSERLASLKVIVAAGAAIAALAGAVALASSQIATKDDVQKAVAAHASVSPDQVAAAPVVHQLVERVEELARQTAAVTATSDDNARDLDWLKGAVFQMAQHQRLDITPPPTRRSTPRRTAP